MARQLRLEAEGGIYHVLNRGNYRADIFRRTKTRAAFLKCLDETCARWSSCRNGGGRAWHGW
jgi:putative transposase